VHRATNRFWNNFNYLPVPVQKISKRKFEILKTNPLHPSLHFKKAGKFWSVRAGLNHRALAVEDGSDFIWVWIGNHDEYERILKGMS